MELDTLSMERAEARKLFLDYRRAVGGRPDVEDAEIMRGYRAMSQGHQLLIVSEALKAGGFNEKGLPNLAIMRADQRWCWTHQIENGRLIFGSSQDQSNRGWGSSRRRPNVGTYPDYLAFDGVAPKTDFNELHAKKLSRPCYRAVVPIVPPALRPDKLHTYHILWEPNWEEQPPPPDPVLLKRISHDLYAVMAVWDLTPIELAVMGRRFAQSSN